MTIQDWISFLSELRPKTYGPASLTQNHTPEFAERLGLPASDCFAVEDAPCGIQATMRADIYRVVLTTNYTSDELTRANRVTDKLSVELFVAP